jgi:hypothetical protein
MTSLVSRIRRSVAVPWSAALFAVALAAAAPPARADAALTSNAPSVDVPVLQPQPAFNGQVDGSWTKAAKVSLDADFTYRRAAEEPTQVFVGQEPGALDIAFVVTQKEAVVAAQHTNGSSVTSDDYVVAYLWPQGTHGFQYSFIANPHGARYQTSSENSAYSPEWTAVGQSTLTGYVVTMRIPLGAIRSAGSQKWSAQFGRFSVATNALDLWAFSPQQQNANDPAFAGTLNQIGIVTKQSTRPKPRAGVYALGELTPEWNGGNTSRVGADFALPVTPTASLVGTIHPDYSNVEVDQQTISPNAFAYQYQEVRPFFTQAAQPFNYSISCSNCPQLLYTPSIPTMRNGYALEGTQGPLTFSLFNAVGYGRDDQAQAFDYDVETKQMNYGINLQHVGVDETTGVHDELTSITTGVGDQHTHFFVYGNAAIERGSLVTDAQDGNYLEAGLGYASATTVAVANYQTLGSQFNPVDSYVAQNDITGYEFYGKRILNFSPHAFVHDVQFQAFFGQYHDQFGLPAQTDASENVFIDFRNLLSLRLFSNYSGLKVLDGEFLPFFNNSVYLGYKVNTNTPSYVQYTGGPYYHGRLDAWSYVSTLPVAPKVHLRLEADENNYLTSYPGEVGGAQWLERAGIDWQLSRNASFDVGVRKITGPYLPNSYSVPDFTPVNAGNFTAAFHFLAAANEFYFVYGNPNSTSTTPALYLKWIRYIGAQKGT